MAPTSRCARQDGVCEFGLRFVCARCSFLNHDARPVGQRARASALFSASSRGSRLTADLSEATNTRGGRPTQSRGSPDNNDCHLGRGTFPVMSLIGKVKPTTLGQLVDLPAPPRPAKRRKWESHPSPTPVHSGVGGCTCDFPFVPHVRWRSCRCAIEAPRKTSTASDRTRRRRSGSRHRPCRWRWSA